MKASQQEAALAFVHDVQLPDPEPVGFVSFDVEETLSLAEARAAVVGSNVVSFVRGVTEERRRLVVQSSLLAQLVAGSQVADAGDVFGWYDAYLGVLGKLGWAIQDRGFDTYAEHADGLEAHEAIAKVAAVLLAPNPAALAVVLSTINALKAASGDSAWFRIFSRESQQAHSARFQVSLVHEGEAEDFLVTLMAFGVEAESSVTQVAFFKFKASRATLKYRSAQVTVGVGPQVAEAIARKVADYQNSYIATLPELPPLPATAPAA